MTSSALIVETGRPDAVFKIRTFVCWPGPGPATVEAATTVAPGNHLDSSGEMLSSGDGVDDQELFGGGEAFFVD